MNKKIKLDTVDLLREKVEAKAKASRLTKLQETMERIKPYLPEIKHLKRSSGSQWSLG